MAILHDIPPSIAEIFSTGDVALADDIFAKEYIDHQKPPWVTVDGPEEFKLIVVSARKSLPDLVVSVVEQIIDGDKIAFRLHWESLNAQRETIEILHINNGKAVAHWGAEAWRKQKDEVN